MSNVRKLMGRLNPTNIRYDLGRGGVPELTATDIAGAVAMIRDPLARAVFCALWWQDGAELERDQVLCELRSRVWNEHSRRALAANKAKIELHQARGELAARRTPSDEDRRLVAHLESRAATTKREAWPSAPEIYHRLVRATLAEVGSPRHCSTCGGRANVQTSTGPKPCGECSGSGKAPYSNRARARAIDISESTYRELWAPIYEWTFSLISDLEATAGYHLAQALGDPAE